MIAVLGEEEAEPAMQQLAAAGERPYRIGRIRARRAGEPQSLIA